MEQCHLLLMKSGHYCYRKTYFTGPYNEYPISYPPAQAENDGECHDTIDEVSGMMSPSLGDPFGLVSPSMVQEGDSLSEEDDYERPKL